MATYFCLVKFTDQGIRGVKDTVKRAEGFRTMAEKFGVTVKANYWTMGRYDAVIVLDGADESVMSTLLSAGALGNIRTETLRALSADDMDRVIGGMT